MSHPRFDLYFYILWLPTTIIWMAAVDRVVRKASCWYLQPLQFRIDHHQVPSVVSCHQFHTLIFERRVNIFFDEHQLKYMKSVNIISWCLTSLFSVMLFLKIRNSLAPLITRKIDGVTAVTEVVNAESYSVVVYTVSHKKWSPEIFCVFWVIAWTF